MEKDSEVKYDIEGVIEYAKENLEGEYKAIPSNVKVIYTEEFLKRPWYIVQFEMEDSRAYACYCEFKEGRFAPIELQDILPELFKFSPDGFYRIG